MDEATAIRALIGAALQDPATGWSLGTFGAGATFWWRADEASAPPDDGRAGRVTPRGGLAFGRPVVEALRPFACETFLGGDAWSHSVALCLPAAAIGPVPPALVRVVGPDREALRADDRADTLIELGLGRAEVRFGLRLKGPPPGWLAAGAMPDLAERIAASGLDLVVWNALGRIESFGAARSGDGPGWHLAPAVLRRGRSHAATAPVPRGLIPLGSLVPPHPCGAPGAIFDAARHRAFEALLARWGDPRLLAAKAHALGHGAPPRGPEDRHARAAARVARAQRRASGAGRETIR